MIIKNDTIDYQEMIELALLEVVKKTLKEIEKKGLPGNHHFYITLKTQHPGVKLPEFLLAKHPDTITLVLQYEFSNLHVSEREFAVTLRFNNKNYYVHVPFEAIINFSDPSVKFTLQFSLPETKDFSNYETDPELGFIQEEDKIISLDDFRKK